MHPRSITIIGAGFSGTVLSLGLLRHCPPSVRIRLVEQSATFGAGLAYSTACSEHLLNVPAGRMSALQDQPRDFLDWLERQPGDILGRLIPHEGSFVPRSLYGGYLRNLLATAIKACPAGRLQLISGKAVAIAQEPGGLSVHLEGGAVIVSSVAVLATGNARPADPCASLSGTSLYRSNPWAGDAAFGLSPDAAVLLIGTGLTMVDAVLRLLESGHAGPIHALSRRGLLPRAHASGSGIASGIEQREIPRRLHDLVRFIRAKSEQIAEVGGSWHSVVDALRPVTRDIWQNWPASERRRFLVHARPWWDVHRHRMAPSVADRIESARNSGQLQIHSGRMTGFAERDDVADVTWRPRGSADMASLSVHRVINCSGTATDIARSSDPLVRGLLFAGMARPDPSGLGFDVTEHGALRGNASDRLFGIGPICRSALWEITAVPDIRAQCEGLAQRIAAMTVQCGSEFHATSPGLAVEYSPMTEQRRMAPDVPSPGIN